MSLASAVYFVQLKWPHVVFILERKTDNFTTDVSATTQQDCHFPALCETKSSRKKKKRKKKKPPPVRTVNLRLRSMRKVRGNPCNYHFRSCQWQGVTLSGYKAFLYAVHILKRHLISAPTLWIITRCPWQIHFMKNHSIQQHMPKKQI